MGRPLAVCELEVGEFFADTQILGTIGRGQTGTSYHVYSNAFSKDFVLKTLVLDDSLSLDWRGALDVQTTQLSKLDHPHIDKIINHGRVKDLWFCLKELCLDASGELASLRDVLRRRGKLGDAEVQLLAVHILKGLEYAHNHRALNTAGFCHGNIKPENILMADTGAKLTDFSPFGLISAEVIESTYSSWLKTLSRQSFNARIHEKASAEALFGIFAGYDYQAPEMRLGSKPTVAADLYAVGVVLHEALTGELPEGSIAAPKAWQGILEKCLQQRPEHRYLSATACLEAVYAAFEVKTAPVPAPKPAYRDSITPQGMVFIPQGTFQIGSSAAGSDAEPEHQVESGGFYMDRCLITVAQFARFVQETGYVTEAEKTDGGAVFVEGKWRFIPGFSWRQPTPNPLPANFELHPVTQVTYADALAFASWRGARLPTEVEWEVAARGNLASCRYPNGNSLTKEQANFGSEGTSAIQTYAPNGYGLYDMAGNVWEWCSSFYQAYPGNSTPSSNFGTKYRVLRGGAWMVDASHCQVSYRNANDPANPYPTVGFRCVMLA